MSVLEFSRVHQGPPELLFDCMTRPEHLTHFWGPSGTTTPLDGIVVELRPGGRFETTMVGADGSAYTMRARYAEIDRPRRLVWIEADVEGAWSGPVGAKLHGAGPGVGMRTEVTFVDLGDGRTEVVTRQTDVPEAYRSAEARAGFNTSLDRLDAYLATL